MFPYLFLVFLNDELIFSSARSMESLYGLGWGLITSESFTFFSQKASQEN